MEKLLLVIKQSIEPFTEVILMITHYLMVLVVSFVNFVIVEKHVIQKVMSKIEGKISISTLIHEKPEDANNRTRIGDWEADTVAGKTGKACLVTLTDRYSRFSKNQKGSC